MQAILSLLGLLLAIWVWNTGHPILAVIVGFLLVGGAGWMLPIWVARAATPRRAAPSLAQSDPYLHHVLTHTPTEDEVAAQAMDEYGVDLYEAVLIRRACIDRPGLTELPAGFVPVYLLPNQRFYLYKRGHSHLGDSILPRFGKAEDGEETVRLTSTRGLQLSIRGERVAAVRDWYSRKS